MFASSIPPKSGYMYVSFPIFKRVYETTTSDLLDPGIVSFLDLIGKIYL